MVTRTVADCMTSTPTTVDVTDTLRTAAGTMAQQDVGALVVRSGRETVGIVTDRDLVVRGLAAGRGPDDRLEGLPSERLVAVGPGDPVEVAVQVMRDAAVRRVPVIDGDVIIGIVSIGDLAVERDPESALADISDAPANR
ncbi:CBS domain-containing protein [Isoptericola sp. 4D.3]|uniref:CBS domain-containing protein n=1 Tax=Isoptericola peretonis TaxID=2918523 RepID=A0ABT0J776_9MICO|nr:CBS domain-containing protein [Isoptericola sp. 4D.3]